MNSRELIERAREALSIYIDWCDAENDHSLADFYQRMDMCSNAEATARDTLATLDAHLSETVPVKWLTEDEFREFSEKQQNRLAAAPSAQEHINTDYSRSAQDVLAERQRQIDTEYFTPDHDDEHDNGDLAKAAAAYAMHAAGWFGTGKNWFWPWADDEWKPTNEPRGMLVKAGALILAEIDRLDRKASA